MPLDEALLARLDERTLALQKGQNRIEERLDCIEKKLMDKANKCPIEGERNEAHESVCERLTKLETEASELRGGRRIAYIIAGGILTLAGMMVGFFI